MVNEAYFSVTGYVATQPKLGRTKDGITTLSMRVGWTPRRIDKSTGEWADQPSSFVSVQCFRKVADNASACLRKGDPVVLKGTLRVREYEDQAGVRRTSVDVVAESVGHDLSRGITQFHRNSGQQEQTAREYDAAQAAASREALSADLEPAERQAGDLVPGNRLPGDRPSADRLEVGSADEAYPSLSYGANQDSEGEREDDDAEILATAEADQPVALPA